MAARSKQVLESFINIYREETCLWELKSKEYHNRPKREAAYERLIAELKKVDPTANKDAVSKKINNLRSSYRKELKKVEASLKWGDDVYQPKLWYFNLLSFLQFHGNERPSCSNFDNDFDSTGHGWQDGRQYDGSELSATDDFDSSNPATYESRHLNSFKPKEDKMDVFAKHIALTLREMSKQQRILAEKLIGDILFEAQMGTLTASNEEIEHIQPSLAKFLKNRESMDDKITIEKIEHAPNAIMPQQKNNHKNSMKRKRLNNTEDTDDDDSHDYYHDSASDEIEVNLGLVKEEDISDEDVDPMGDESLCVEMPTATSAESESASYVPVNVEVLKKAITTVNRLTDECCIFGDFVASELRSLKSPKLKMKLQSRIQKAILKIAEEDEYLQDSAQKDQGQS